MDTQENSEQNGQAFDGAEVFGEIANQFALSVTTVSTYRSRVLEKMGMKSNADLTRYALEKKLI